MSYPRRFLVALALTLASLLVVAAPASAAGTWSWPVTGPILRAYDPPLSTYGAGHRGIDIGAPAGTLIRAPADGTVSFAGKVGGNLFLTIGHGGGVSSTYSWVSVLLVHKNDAVVAGQPVAHSGSGHPGDLDPSLHLGVKIGSAYADPLEFLAPIDLSTMIRLAPV
jgi:murein DD-endopeptidase MepM/ murein hydrolase activator NlpD